MFTNEKVLMRSDVSTMRDDRAAFSVREKNPAGHFTAAWLESVAGIVKHEL